MSKPAATTPRPGPKGPDAAGRGDLYARVTAKIVADLERGVRPWARPWSAEGAGQAITRPLRANGVPYRGINIVLLWAEADARGFRNPVWMTYKQAQSLGGQVRKGEAGCLVVYADRFTKTETAADGSETEREIAFFKGYTVFNVEQIDGLPAIYTAQSRAGAPTDGQAPCPASPTLAAAEAFLAATGAVVRHGGDRALYAPGRDAIQMPPPGCFRDPESYAATLAHELVHWTGHPARLARDLSGRFGTDAYAAEELVAELGAAFVCADLGLAAEPREDHAEYLAHWLAVLKANSRAIFTAASAAQAAADFLHGLQPTPPTAEVESVGGIE